jgi:hypothetical protein
LWACGLRNRGDIVTHSAENDAPVCECPTDDYCPKCHPRWHAKWQAEREVLAQAWDDGYDAGHKDARAVQATYPDQTPNPHRLIPPAATEES